MLRTAARVSLLTVCLALATMHAAAIPGLFSTGVDALGNPLPGGAPDPHYTISGGGAGPASFVTVCPGCLGWIGNIGPAQWVDPDGNGGNTGAFDYTTTFDLTGFDPTTASITGSFAVDDQLTDVVLNGSSVPVVGLGNWFSYTPLDINSGFIAGINTLTFSLVNSGGPGGLQVSLSGTAITPEPGSILLFVSGIAACLVRHGRRRTCSCRCA